MFSRKKLITTYLIGPVVISIMYIIGLGLLNSQYLLSDPVETLMVYSWWWIGGLIYYTIGFLFYQIHKYYRLKNSYQPSQNNSATAILIIFLLLVVGGLPYLFQFNFAYFSPLFTNRLFLVVYFLIFFGAATFLSFKFKIKSLIAILLLGISFTAFLAAAAGMLVGMYEYKFVADCGNSKIYSRTDAWVGTPHYRQVWVNKSVEVGSYFDSYTLAIENQNGTTPMKNVYVPNSYTNTKEFDEKQFDAEEVYSCLKKQNPELNFAIEKRYQSLY
ncbi:MAG: hypothetical protein OHK0017_06510 [Patescibacteria group bacterium]